MSVPAEPHHFPTGEYAPGHRYFVDDIVLRDGLALHFYAEASDPGGRQIHWINFRMVEMVELEGENGAPTYPTEEYVRPGTVTGDPRAAVHFASGFIKWDGCCEIELDHHMCGVRMARQVADALLHVFAYAAKSHGFEDCE